MNKWIVLGVSSLLLAPVGNATVSFTSATRSVEATVDVSNTGETDSDSSSAYGLLNQSVTAENAAKTVTVITSLISKINNANTSAIDFDIFLMQIEGTRSVSAGSPGDLEDGGVTQALFEMEFSLDTDTPFSFSLPYSYDDQSNQSQITLFYELIQDPAGVPITLGTGTVDSNNAGSGTFAESQSLPADDYRFTVTMTATGSLPNAQQQPISMTAVPEPQSMVLAGLGLALGLIRRRRP